MLSKDMEVMVKMDWERVQAPMFTSASFALCLQHYCT